jgi:hypothetical protein
MINKAVIYQALMDNDIVRLREISNYFYKTSGIYHTVCNYWATMYRYDWYVVPEVMDKTVKEDKVVEDFRKILRYLDNSYITKTCGDIALSVVKNGAYYGYLIDSPHGLILQELPVNYCRARFNVGNSPAVEFNMKFFD